MTFDAQNPVIGSLVQENDIGKKNVFSKIIEKASNPIDIELNLDLTDWEIEWATATTTITTPITDAQNNNEFL